MPLDLLTAADHAEQTAPVRFSASPAYALPLGDVITAAAGELATGHGLVGPASPLPLALADALADAADPCLADLHHARIAALVTGLRAADLARDLSPRAAWPRRIAALLGLTHLSSGTAHASQDHLSSGTAHSSPDRDTLLALRLAPIFAAPDRTLRSLSLALHRLLGRTGPAPRLRCVAVPGALTPISPDLHTRLGAPAARLGRTAALGTAIRLPSAAARLHLGQLPPDASLPRIRALVDLYLPEPVALELVVDRPPAPTILGHHRL